MREEGLARLLGEPVFGDAELLAADGVMAGGAESGEDEVSGVGRITGPVVEFVTDQFASLFFGLLAKALGPINIYY